MSLNYLVSQRRVAANLERERAWVEQDRRELPFPPGVKLPAAVLLLWHTPDGGHHASEHIRGDHLMAELHEMGRRGAQLLAAFRGSECLSPSSLRALEAYLRYGDGLFAFRHKREHDHHIDLSRRVLDRYGWAELQGLLDLRWIS